MCDQGQTNRQGQGQRQARAQAQSHEEVAAQVQTTGTGYPDHVVRARGMLRGEVRSSTLSQEDMEARILGPFDITVEGDGAPGLEMHAGDVYGWQDTGEHEDWGGTPVGRLAIEGEAREDSQRDRPRPAVKILPVPESSEEPGDLHFKYFEWEIVLPEGTVFSMGRAVPGEREDGMLLKVQDTSREKLQNLARLAEILIEKQRPYLTYLAFRMLKPERVDSFTNPLLLIRPRTQTYYWRALRAEKDVVSKIFNTSYLALPHIGCTSWTLFVSDSKKRVDYKDEALLIAREEVLRHNTSDLARKDLEYLIRERMRECLISYGKIMGEIDYSEGGERQPDLCVRDVGAITNLVIVERLEGIDRGRVHSLTAG